MTFRLEDFGLLDYEAAYALQRQRLAERLAGTLPDTLLMGEHPPVITLGRGTNPANVLRPAVPVVAVERGGDVTLHVPGQLIAYPIRRLEGPERDLHRHLRLLEAALMDTLAQFGLAATRNPGWTGAWVETPEGLRKIASIGVAVSRWVTYHGLALNVDPDMAAFAQINPCGLDSGVMTSMRACLGRPVTVAAVKPVLAAALDRAFALTPGEPRPAC